MRYEQLIIIKSKKSKMKRKLIKSVSLLLFFLSIIFVNVNYSSNYSKNDFSLSLLSKKSYADGETTMQECQEENCPNNGIVCPTECDDIKIAYWWHKS